MTSSFIECTFDEASRAVENPYPQHWLVTPSTCISTSHPMVFDWLGAICIHQTVLKTGDVSGPSGLGATSWVYVSLFSKFPLIYVML